MAVILYCGHEDCKVGYAANVVIPVICPTCERETKWVVAPFAITQQDRRFLRSLRIQSD